jgi:hypothetical protein
MGSVQDKSFGDEQSTQSSCDSHSGWVGHGFFWEGRVGKRKYHVSWSRETFTYREDDTLEDTDCPHTLTNSPGLCYMLCSVTVNNFVCLL